MTTGKTLAWAGLIGLIGLVSPAAAHHSFAMFDQTKLLNTKGTVSQFRWTNPHSFLVLDVNGTKYTLECNSTNMMSRAGWKLSTVKAGDKVGITYYPLRTGQPGGMLKTVTLPGGQTLSAW
ncbi:hypothetical protein SUS17_2414 [Sphingomonas sp. S17]|jgi:hypothetical protein|uniref:Uncharacterized protein n=2 Tax=Sphingomonas paucimobilis TaxID=13689 RepID=A0A411LL45_SPHPI|nr:MULTISPECIES: DUF6152 family protein [Sphingomonas]EGI54723.1 hypothetical protein SUS17_2414 [Sphingomonas sp. S17]MBQ1481771.1 hypothetical protein [Sphingomonas sp.]MCM3681685.1 DUF6152 family protein [Sphingomonas paucimobilis]MDG5970250.1 hypothetical protein [Sphingomonas paucimobilis]NNG56210.1 hypothetical protein [Sphingomonas paucimobilis]